MSPDPKQPYPKVLLHFWVAEARGDDVIAAVTLFPQATSEAGQIVFVSDTMYRHHAHSWSATAQPASGGILIGLGRA